MIGGGGMDAISEVIEGQIYGDQLSWKKFDYTS